MAGLNRPGAGTRSTSGIEWAETKISQGILSDDPERLPPPPFWRTRYFALDVMPRRPELDPIEIRRVIAAPAYRRVQSDGRIRLYGFSARLGRYLRIVLLSDGETVHNAFPDEGFTP